MTKPKKINVQYIESNKTGKKSDDDVLDSVKQKLQQTDSEDCPFC